MLLSLRRLTVFLVIAAGLLFAGRIGAQTPAATPAQTAAPNTGAAPSAVPTPAKPHLTRDGKPLAKEVREQCRSEAGTKGLAKGDAYRAFMKECIGKQRPDLVKSYECRQEARSKKIEAGERKAFLKACRARP